MQEQHQQQAKRKRKKAAPSLADLTPFEGVCLKPRFELQISPHLRSEKHSFWDRQDVETADVAAREGVVEIIDRQTFNSNPNTAVPADPAELPGRMEWVEVDLETGSIRCAVKGIELQAKPFSSVQMDIYQAGGLFEYGRKTAT